MPLTRISLRRGKPAAYRKAIRQFADAGIRALKAVIANIDASGELKQVSFGTPVFNDLDGYRKVPLTSMPYGQAMAILALGEFRRAFA